MNITSQYYEKYLKYKQKYLNLKQVGGQNDIELFLYKIEHHLMDILIYFCKSISDNKLPYAKNNGVLSFDNQPVRNLGNIADILNIIFTYPQMSDLNIKSLCSNTINYYYSIYKEYGVEDGAKAFLFISMILYKKIFNTNEYDNYIDILKNNLLESINNITGEINTSDQNFYAGEILHALNIYRLHIGIINFNINNVENYYTDYFMRNYVDKQNDLLPFYINWQLQAFIKSSDYTELLIKNIDNHLENSSINSFVEYCCSLEGLMLHIDLPIIYNKYSRHIDNIITYLDEYKNNNYDNLRFDELGHAANMLLNILNKVRLKLIELKPIPSNLLSGKIDKNNILNTKYNIDNYYNKNGVFVTIYKDNELAGCVGTFYNNSSNEELPEKVVNSTVMAAQDSRFDYGLDYFKNKSNITTEICILGPINLFQLDNFINFYIPRYHGIILYCDNVQKTTYLPSVMDEQRWINNYELDVSQVIESLKRKGNIDNCNNISIGLYAGYDIL